MFQSYLDKNDWKYAREETRTEVLFRFSLGGLGGPYGKVDFIVAASDAECQNFAILPVKADEKRGEIAEYFHRVNYPLRFGEFQLDYGDGEIRFHLAYPAEVFQGKKADEYCERLLMIPARMIEIYGRGLAAIILGMATPEDAVSLSENSDTNKSDSK